MSVAFNLSPVLTNEQILSVLPHPASISLYYYDNGIAQSLQLADQTENQFDMTAVLRDPKCDWYPETHALHMRRSVSVADASSWFGQGGVVPADASIGIAQQWISTKSETRGFIPMGEIRRDDRNQLLTAEYVFPQNSLKGSLLLKTIIYVKNAGTASSAGLAHSGTILGVLDCCEIFVDGNGSVFPIATINDPKQPLWYVYFDDTADPMQDAFDQEHVEIRLNRAHPCYEQLKIESSLRESPLFLEVLSSAMVVIVQSAKELLGADWDNVVNGQSTYEHGSIAEAVYYFVAKLGWNITSPAKLAKSIHSFFDTKLQGVQYDHMESN